MLWMDGKTLFNHLNSEHTEVPERLTPPAGPVQPCPSSTPLKAETWTPKSPADVKMVTVHSFTSLKAAAHHILRDADLKVLVFARQVQLLLHLLHGSLQLIKVEGGLGFFFFLSWIKTTETF